MDDHATSTAAALLPVRRFLAAWRRRVVLAAAIDGLLEAALAAGLLLLAGLLLGIRPLGWPVVLLAATALAWTGGRALAGHGLERLAPELDRLLGSHDRLSSALQFGRLSRPTSFMRAHLEETAAWLERSRPSLPRRRPRRAGAALLLALWTGALLSPSGAVLPPPDEAPRAPAVTPAARKLAGRLARARRQAQRLRLGRLENLLAAAASEIGLPIEIPPPAPPPESSPRPGDDEGRDRPAPAPPARGSEQRLSAPATAAAGPAYLAAGKFDALSSRAYRQAFAELDRALRLGELQPADIRLLAGHVERISAALAVSAGQEDTRAGAELARPPAGQAGDSGGFDRALAPLLQKSFGEFLRRYADHLAGRALSRDGSPATAQPPPSGLARLPRRGQGRRLTRQADPRALPGGMSATPTAGGSAAARGALNRQAARQRGGGVAQAGGSGAGSGGGGGRGQLGPPPVLPRPRRVEWLDLPARLGSGRSLFELLQRFGRGQGLAGSGGDTRRTRRLLGEFARMAELAGSSGAVPADMRDYVRAYFLAIRRLAGGGSAP